MVGLGCFGVHEVAVELGKSEDEGTGEEEGEKGRRREVMHCWLGLFLSSSLWMRIMGESGDREESLLPS